MKGPVAGVIAATIIGLVTWILPHAYRQPLLAGLLWLTVGMYLGMALMDGPKQVWIQAVGAAPVAVLAMASTRWPWLLIVAWLAHPAWDLLHQFGAIRTKIHPITVGFCLVFDVLVAGIAAWLL